VIARISGIALIALIVLFLLAPIVVVMATSVTTTAYPVFPPRGFTLRWYGRFLDSPEFLEAARFSLIVASLTALIACAVGTPAALALARYRVRGRELVTGILLSPVIFPSVVLGLAILVFYHRVGLAGTLPGIVGAHVLLTAPFVLRMVMASLAQSDPSLQEAARNLGASPLRTFWKVTVPLIRPGLLAGGLCAFLLSFDELVVTLFIAGPTNQTLPIRVFTYLEYTSDPMIAAISTVFALGSVLIGFPLYLRFFAGRKD
jgi:putative spermidine/putrescine transport system permease protein